MNQEQAKILFHEGAILLFLDVPEGTEFGIDWNSWNVGSKFKGVKMIPPGVHFVYYSACSGDGQTAPRTGFFHNFTAKEMLIKRWDKVKEDMVSEMASEEDVERYSSQKEELDQYLGPYPYDNYKKWVSLTNHLKADLVTRLEPMDGKISSVTEFISERSTTQSRKEAREKAQSEALQTGEDAKLPVMKEKEGGQIRFTDIPKKYPTGATPAEITKYSMDSSYALNHMIETKYTSSVDILGELQFSFICFIVGQVFDGFEQWKKLVHLLCTCETALNEHSDLYTKFISVLHYQVREIPQDFFVDIVSENNFLTSTLQVLFSTMETVEIDPSLRKRGMNFREHLTKKLKWDFESVPDEDAPLVVETE